MARLMSQIKGGYYAAPAQAVAAVIERLRRPASDECLVLDPCAGEGFALVQLAQALGAIPFGIELSEDRGDTLRKAIPDDQVLAPADFLRSAISLHSFSFVWCNPPYDYAAGNEGRVELQFLERTVSLLADRGVLALVCPEDVASSYRTIEFFHQWFCDISALTFPKDVRKYRETVLLGCKRKQPCIDRAPNYSDSWLERRMENRVIYQLPVGQRPKQFRKSEPTDTELARLVADSPLRFQLNPPADKVNDRPRPPMSPGIGHRAMLLASGYIDGLVCPSNELPHVIRGTASKQSYVASSDTCEDEEGNTTTRTVLSERPRLLIRVLTSQGEIINLE